MVRIAITALLCAVALPVGAQDAWRDDYVEAVRAESGIREAMFTGPVSFWASMSDDGTRRDGFAEFLCVVAMQNGMPVGDFFVIKIWDFHAMLRKEMREIGRFNCERKG